MKDKRIYFFDNEHDWMKFKEKKGIKRNILNGHLETRLAIQQQEKLIFTYDLSMLSTRLFEDNYRIFVKQYNYPMIEVKLGGYNNWTHRQVKMWHNLLKFYQSGEMITLLKRI